jgi:hypothetical protein
MDATAALVELREYVSGAPGAPLRIDREKGIIFGVKILGEKGNAVYPEDTRRRAIPLMEGARVYVDHAPRGQVGETRSYRDAFGTVRALRETGTGIYADYHFPPKHPLAEQLFWDAENAPENLGFSIASLGRGEHRDAEGRQIIEEIRFDRRSHSVDLVSSPATTRGLFESRTTPVKKKLSALIEALKGPRPGYARALREMAEAGLMSPDTEYEEPGMKQGDVPEEADHEQALKDGFRAAVLAVLDDDSLDTKAKLAKFRDILAAEEKLLGDDSGGAADDESEPTSTDDETEAEESRRSGRTVSAAAFARLQETFRLRLHARDLCAEAGIVPTRTLRKALDACTSAAEMKELIEEHRAALARTAPEKPRSAAPWTDTAWAGAGTMPVREDRSAGEGLALEDTEEARRKRVAALRGAC